MKKFKKLVALLLAGVLALAMLTGCNQTNVDLSDKLAQKTTETYARAYGVKAEEAQLAEDAAAINKAMLDKIGEDGVLEFDTSKEKYMSIWLDNENVGQIVHNVELTANNRHRWIVTVFSYSVEHVEDNTRFIASVAALKPEQVNAILSGSLDGLEIDKFGKRTEGAEVKGVGVSAKKLKDGTYCFVLTLDMLY